LFYIYVPLLNSISGTTNQIKSNLINRDISRYSDQSTNWTTRKHWYDCQQNQGTPFRLPNIQTGSETLSVYYSAGNRTRDACPRSKPTGASS